jgi:hypothetical protein
MSASDRISSSRCERQARLRLSDEVRLRVRYQDSTRFGSTLSGRIDELVRTGLSPALAIRKQAGLPGVVQASTPLLAQAFDSAGPLGQLYRKPGQLREDCLHPPVGQVRPAGLVLDRADGRQDSIAVDRSLLPDLASWLGDWQLDAVQPRNLVAAHLWSDLAGLGAFDERELELPLPARALFVGHASVRLGSAGDSVLVDPLLMPRSSAFGAYQPLSAGQLCPAGVFITHSHPDHFDVGSLLRLGAEIPIHVPFVPRESILAVDMEARLAELGFKNVHPMHWGEQRTLGGTRVSALPFHGEQPTTAERLHPELRNAGNLYLVQTDGRRYVCLADAGQDAEGDVRRVAGDVARSVGSTDVVFGGYRSWALYPISYVFTSVARYVLFVPPRLWNVRQQIMNDCDDLFDTAEAFQAHVVVPYADGGAPWYWQLGLGPDLSSGTTPRSTFDPPPESVLAGARARSSCNGELIPSPVAVSLLRPGDALVLDTENGCRVTSHPGHRWPFDGPVPH